MYWFLYQHTKQAASTEPAFCKQVTLFLLLSSLALVLGGCAGFQGSPAPLPPATSGNAPVTSQLSPVFERYRGTPYQWGGVTAEGFDCSGFIVTAYREALGVQLPRTTQQMLASGRVVQRDRIQPGDVLFFHIAGKDQHAGIYMGNYQFIHASTSSGVIQSALNARYWRNRYSQARRFLD